MKIGTREVGPGHPCCIVAEISNNHNGDRDRCGRLIDAAQAAGADVVKFQAYTPDELVALRGDGPAPEPWGLQGYTMRTLYEKARTPLDWFPKIRDHCDRMGIPWFSSVFGPESLACLEAVGCPAYKISSFERNNGPLVERVLGTGKPGVVSTPDYNDRWRWRRRDPGASRATEDMLELYCPPGYPNTPRDYNLRDAFIEPRDPWPYDGVSIHCKDPVVPLVAAACGAKMLELHFMLEAEPSELESSVSLNEIQFREMVNSVRRAEELLGD